MNLKDKISKKGIKMKEICDLHFHIGVMTGYNDAFFIDEDTKNRIINEDVKSKEIIKPLIRGKDIKRWQIEYKDMYLILY